MRLAVSDVPDEDDRTARTRTASAAPNKRPAMSRTHLACTRCFTPLLTVTRPPEAIARHAPHCTARTCPWCAVCFALTTDTTKGKR